MNKLVENGAADHDTAQKGIAHLLFEEHDLYGGRKRFDLSYDISMSLQRLLEGKDVQAHDKLLLPHEALESIYMAEGLGYDEAHRRASATFDYDQALDKWLTESDLE